MKLPFNIEICAIITLFIIDYFLFKLFTLHDKRFFLIVMKLIQLEAQKTNERIEQTHEKLYKNGEKDNERQNKT